jgi:hypothetical protein
MLGLACCFLSVFSRSLFEFWFYPTSRVETKVTPSGEAHSEGGGFNTAGCARSPEGFYDFAVGCFMEVVSSRAGLLRQAPRPRVLTRRTPAMLARVVEV